jgi:hypothetical protein
MDDLHTSVHPRFTAYAGRHLGKLLLLLGVSVVLYKLSATPYLQGRLTDQVGGNLTPGDVVQLAHRGLRILAAIALAVLAIGVARVKTMRITVDRGRLQIRKGIFARRVSNIELWRVRNIELDRTLANRLTGDGAIVVELTGTATTSGRRRARRRNHNPQQGEIIHLVGLTYGQRLDDAYQQLLNLVFLLRGNPVVKGIIQ